jgi:hypothetical protein
MNTVPIASDCVITNAVDPPACASSPEPAISPNPMRPHAHRHRSANRTFSVSHLPATGDRVPCELIGSLVERDAAVTGDLDEPQIRELAA